MARLLHPANVLIVFRRSQGSQNALFHRVGGEQMQHDYFVNTKGQFALSVPTALSKITRAAIACRRFLSGQ